ncbi:MAG: hypothetical protein H6636_05965 [Anaerolineales bacterium]|nr:hypothetical protein [Anaerolineales bacterium]
MTEILPALREIAQTLFFVGFLCCFPTLVISLIVYTTAINLTQNRLAHKKLAEKLGYTRVNEGHILKTWYSGTYEGRPIAINVRGQIYRYYSGDRNRIGVHFYLRIAMPVQTPATPGLVTHHRGTKGIPQSFTEAFDVSPGMFLSTAARQAMLTFAYKGYPTGFKKDLTLRFTPGLRNLTYGSRAEIPDLPPEMLPDASMLLLFEHPDAAQSPKQFQTLLDDLLAVAQSIETETLSPHLPAPVPPTPGPARHLPWVITGLVVLGLPALICVCSMVYTLLDT